MELNFAVRQGRTTLAKMQFHGPLRVQRPFYPEPAPAETAGRAPASQPCHCCLLHPPGGLVSGDDLSLEVIVSDGAITGNLSTNAPLSTANLQAAFWLHDRYLWTGRMNDVERTFLNVAPNVQQRPVQLRACCDLLGLQPGAVAMTALGAGFFGGALAVITRLELNEEDDWATFTLRYSV